MAVWNVIDHTTVGSGGAASWAESSISGSYSHLCIKASIRNEAAGDWVYNNMRVGNGGLDTTSGNYTDTRLRAVSSSPDSSSSTSMDGFQYMPCMAAAGNEANYFSPLEIWIPNYANTTGFKSLIVKQATLSDATGTGDWWVGIWGCLWHSTSAITDVAIYGPTYGTTDIAEHSTFTLYGIN